MEKPGILQRLPRVREHIKWFGLIWSMLGVSDLTDGPSFPTGVD